MTNKKARKNKKNHKKQTARKQNKNLFFNILLISLLTLIFINTYSIHFSNPYPIHVDEWHHLAQIIAAESGKFNYNPYFGEYHRDLEICFHTFWAFFFKVTKLNEVLTYSFLPAIFAVITAITLYFLMLKITNKTTAILSLIVFLSLKSSVNILGIKYFTPLTMSFPLLLLTINYFIQFTHDKKIKTLLKAAILYILTFLIYPPAGVIILPAFIIEILTNKELLKKHTWLKHLAIATIILSFLALIFLAKKNMIEGLFLFKPGWTGYEVKYSISSLFGILTTTFSLIGIITTIKTQKNHFLTTLVIIPLFIVFLFNNFNFTILVPYQRAIQFSLLLLTPLSAIGIYETLNYIKKKTNNTVTGITLLVIIWLILTHSYPEADNKQTYSWEVLDNQMYLKLDRIRQEYPDSSIVVMTPLQNTPAIYPVSRQKAQALIPAQLGANYKQDERIIDNIKYFSSKITEEEKRRILKKWNVGVVLEGS